MFELSFRSQEKPNSGYVYGDLEKTAGKKVENEEICNLSQRMLDICSNILFSVGCATSVNCGLNYAR